MIAAHERTARTRDGCALSYRLIGSSLKRVALVHSLAMEKSFWDLVVAELTTTVSVLTYDCRGHGASSKPAGPYTIGQFADDLADMMDCIDWPSAVVVGASMGGAVALGFAAQYPQRTQGLGLIDTTAWYGADAAKHWAKRADSALRDGLEGLVEFQTTRWFTDQFREQNPAVVRRSVEVFLRNDRQAYAETCRMLGAFDLRPALAGIACPTAVIVGREDYATPVAMAELLHQEIAGSSLTVIEDGRHLTPLEHPRRIAEEIRCIMGGNKS